jgi:hypothetical protein
MGYFSSSLQKFKPRIGLCHGENAVMPVTSEDSNGETAHDRREAFRVWERWSRRVVRVRIFFPHGGDYRREDSIAAMLGIVKN